MDFKNYLQKTATEIDTELEKLLTVYKDKGIGEDPRLEKLLNIGIDSARGGKRLRAVLIKLGYEIGLNGQESNPDIIKACGCIEMFQAGVLAHDDIIDQSPTRRGKPTVYQALGGDHHAISQAICIGDMGIFLAFQTLTDTNFEPDLKNRAVQMLTHMAINTVFGEMLDIELPFLEGDKSEKDVIKIHRLKTAYYTIVYPLKIGGVLANASEDLLNKFEVFGENLGIAFQIQDDILGVFGDEKTLGKSATSDIEEGKLTTLYVEALIKSDKSQKEILKKYYGQGQIGEEELELVRQVLMDTGARDYSKKLAEDYVKKAKKVISEITSDTMYQNLLTEMADFLVEREK